ncbi:HEPN domain-containing protein [Pseudotabrizicola alkalilacus]|uniref:HEPN domain-containing protein n=1 Tax=Pseudotabrizicola alkalilacus TaxID=2305252 RepID=UPI0011C1A0AE|nr:HEPN domain-containing protein [Pseudotabrizicola alkalilacus]
MPPLTISSEEQRIDKLSVDLRAAADEADLPLQHVFSSHLVLAGAGHVEQSVIFILSEYGRVNGNAIVKRFIEKTVARNNSLDCDKVKKILDHFHLDWWSAVEVATTGPERDAVDSLKTLRDQVAHGKRNGTGFSVVQGYYLNSKRFVRAVSSVVLGY